MSAADSQHEFTTQYIRSCVERKETIDRQIAQAKKRATLTVVLAVVLVVSSATLLVFKFFTNN